MIIRVDLISKVDLIGELVRVDLISKVDLATRVVLVTTLDLKVSRGDFKGK